MQDKADKKNSDARLKANAKYDKANYKMFTVKIPLAVWEKVLQNTDFKNNNQFVNTAIREKIKRDNDKE